MSGHFGDIWTKQPKIFTTLRRESQGMGHGNPMELATRVLLRETQLLSLWVGSWDLTLGHPRI
jgi:hypothetical protein